MITESYYWKRPLLAGAAVIQKYMDKKRTTDAQFARIEREIFIGFYAIHKILEAVGKVGPETREIKVKLKRYNKTSVQPKTDWYNRHEFWDLYNLDEYIVEHRDLIYVSHKIIHSFIFTLSGDEDGHGAFFTSDRDKDSHLYFMRTNEIVRVFEAVGNDYPAGFQSWRDKDTQELKWSVPRRT